MANKPTSRNWNDIQVSIATISMALSLALWNMFAGPDRESAAKRAQEQAALSAQTVVTAPSIVLAPPTPLADGKILFGGSAPQTRIVIQGGGGGGGSQAGGGAPVTSTSSS